MPRVKTIHDLFMDEIRDLYDAEKQLTKALPKMAKAATTPNLKEAFESHLAETQGQVQRLEEIFAALGEKGTGKKCAAMTGLVKEGQEMVNETDDSAVRDAGLIAAAQKVEHYEMSGYGSARTLARMLGNTEAERLLEQTLKEEKEADRKLNDIAVNMVNENAMNESGDRETPKTRSAGGGRNGRQ